MYILSKDQMTALDKATCREYNMSSELLMEIAGKSCYDRINDICSLKNLTNKAFLIICGTGNNGGDGLVIARWLVQNDNKCSILILGNPDKMTSETHNNYLRCLKLNIPTQIIQDISTLNELSFEESIIIDAVFGIGYKGDLNDFYIYTFTLLQKYSLLTFSIDIPSGINAENGMGNSASIKADYTLTMANPKYGHFLNSGKEYSGILDTIDIGIPHFLYSQVKPLVSLLDVAKRSYPKRFLSSHKGDYGRIAIFAGSDSFTGAAVLCSNACLKSGAGLVTLYYHESLRGRYDANLIEVMKKTVNTHDQIPDQVFLSNELRSSDCILIGPGIGKSEYALNLLKTVIELSENKILIIDADAINLLSENAYLLDSIKNRNVVLTPHLLEFSRLIDKSPLEISEKSLEYLHNFVEEMGITVLLKSSVSICASPDTMIFINKGNDGLSTGGSGDVLAGIIAAFSAQNYKYFIKNNSSANASDLKTLLTNSVASAAYLLGETAEYLNKTLDTPAITPTEIINNLFKK